MNYISYDQLFMWLVFCKF